MNFLVIGGGCYGTYYCRQLLRGAVKLGLEKITVVDHQVDCQVRREIADPRIEHLTTDWHDFLLPYFHEQVARRRSGVELTDHYVPPCIGPHFLFELFETELKRECPTVQLTHPPFGSPVGTPLDMKLADGNRALSFAEWICPHSCIEPRLCPVIRQEKAWDMGEHLSGYFEEYGLKVDTYHLLPCRHLAMGVGPIPMQLIVDEYLQFSSRMLQPGRHLAALATISSCHGLVGLMEVSQAGVSGLPHGSNRQTRLQKAL